MNRYATKITVKLDLNEIARLRREKRWTLKALTERMGDEFIEVNVRNTLHRSGRGAHSSEKFAFALAEALGVDVHEIIDNNEGGE
jgi:hypothetical protein